MQSDQALHALLTLQAPLALQSLQSLLTLQTTLALETLLPALSGSAGRARAERP